MVQGKGAQRSMSEPSLRIVRMLVERSSCTWNWLREEVGAIGSPWPMNCSRW